MAALARELAQRHEVTVLTSQALGLPAKSVEDGVRVERAPVLLRQELAVASMPSMFSYLPAAAWRARSLRHSGDRFDVVNTHFVVPTGPVGQWIADRFRTPNVLSVHGGDLYDPSKKSSPHRHPWLRRPIRHMLERADLVVGQSNNTVQHVSQIYGVHRDVDLIPLGIVRPPKVDKVPRAHFGLPDDAYVLVTIGRLIARKQTTQLVEAIARSGIANAHLLIVGSGPDEEAIRRAAAAHGVSDRVHLLGFVSDEEKYRALAVADVFASTSQHEGFGLVFLEAMAFGLPVVCYDHGGQTDFLATGVTGHVVHLDDVDAFSLALADLNRSPEARREIGGNNLRHVEAFFIDRCAERYEQLFERAIATRRPA
jgi:glycosyltransferase involved in cell wall biosynthesis